MNRVIEWFAKNSVAANLLMLMILAAGLVTAPRIKQEVFPEFALDIVTVSVVYRGAAPEEVEEGVCVRVEEAIQGLEGIKRMTSTANEGIGTVTVELALGADPARMLDDIKSRVDAIDTFPEETEQPVIREVTNQRQVIDVAVSGEADEATLKVLAEQVRDEIAALPDITLVSLSGARPYEISIEVSESALRQHGLTFDQVADAIRRSSIDLPGGSVRTEGGEILLRTKGQAYREREFEDLILLTRSDGTRLHLGDVARVVDGFAETDQFARFDGERAVVVQVFRTGEQSAIQVADQVMNYIDGAQARMPEGISLTIWQDQSKVLRDRLSLLARNGLTGLVLVFITLTLFLKLRLAFWVSVGIPVSFLGALWLMPVSDVSINVISLFAFILVLGIVVDDAIVTGENIFSRQERSGDGLRGAIEGAKEVAVPVTFGVATTVVAFVPLLMVEGTTGKIMRVIPVVVISCLIFSWIESKLILPMHLSHGSTPSSRRGLWDRFQGAFGAGLQWFIRRVYRPSLELGIAWRYLTLAIGVVTLFLAASLVAGGFVSFEFLPAVEADYVSAAVTMPKGTPARVTADAVHALERSADQLARDIEDETGLKIFRHTYSTIGEQPFRSDQARNDGGSASTNASGHLGEVTLELLPAEQRVGLSSESLARRWRELTGAIPDVVELSFSASIFSAGEDINVELVGRDLEKLRSASARLRQRLGEYTGVYEISDSFRDGKKEVKLSIKPEAETLGLTLSDLGRQVRQAFFGEEAQRIQRGRDDVRVMVRYPAEERRSLGDMENMRIRTPDGREVPFSQVAAVEMGRGYSSIKRVDRRRAINVIADVDASQASPGSIIADLRANVLPEILADFPGVTYSFEGQSAQQRDTMGGLKRGFALALLGIYALLAIPLRSYTQPFIIMSAIPFGLVGAVAGHVIMGINLTILSMFGIVALAGVVVNDSLVMVDFINRKRQENESLAVAVREAGVARFRPILLTSVTTFAGLYPLIAEKSLQAQFLIPMAVSLAFGVVFSTVISLMLVPAGFMVLDDIRGLLVRYRRRARRLVATESTGRERKAPARTESAGSVA